MSLKTSKGFKKQKSQKVSKGLKNIGLKNNKGLKKRSQKASKGVIKT